MNGMVGFNPQEAIRFIIEIRDLYTNKSGDQYKYMTEVVYETWAKTWYAPKSLEVWHEITDYYVINLYSCDIVALTFGVYHRVKEAFNSWVQATQSYNAFSFPAEPEHPNVSFHNFPLEAREDGFRGIITENVPTLLNQLKIWQGNMIDVINQFDMCISAHSDMFLGSNQMENFREDVSSARTRINQIVEKITDMINKEIEGTAEAYTETAQANATRFSSGN